MIERIWVEVNNRLNYPIKVVFTAMENSDEIDMTDGITKFCVSQLGLALAEVGLNQVVHAWNAHPVPRKYTSVMTG